MSEKILKFENIRVNKKEFNKSKQAIDLGLINVDKIVVSDKFKHTDESFKVFFGYKKDEIIKPLCIILPQMNGYIKYFENSGKNMSFLIKNDEMWKKYDKIWDVTKDKLGIKFHSESVYENKYLKAKVKEFDGVIKTNFLGKGIPKENMHYAYIACVTVNYVMKLNKKYFPQVYLEESKYKIKKRQMHRFINAELKLDSDSDSDLEAESEYDAVN